MQDFNGEKGTKHKLICDVEAIKESGDKTQIKITHFYIMPILKPGPTGYEYLGKQSDKTWVPSSEIEWVTDSVAQIRANKIDQLLDA